MHKLLSYIDPGTMNFLLQLILGAVAAGWVAFKMFGKKILALFGIGKKSEEQTTSDNEV